MIALAKVALNDAMTSNFAKCILQMMIGLDNYDSTVYVIVDVLKCVTGDAFLSKLSFATKILKLALGQPTVGHSPLNPSPKSVPLIIRGFVESFLSTFTRECRLVRAFEFRVGVTMKKHTFHIVCS